VEKDAIASVGVQRVYRCTPKLTINQEVGGQNRKDVLPTLPIYLVASIDALFVVSASYADFQVG
jgi:hypothetical protein